MAVVLTQAEVRALLPMDTCIELMRGALRALAADRAVNPLRWLMRLPGSSGILGFMPGYVMDAPAALGLKAVAVFPRNHGTAYDAHQGVVVLFDPGNGVPTAIMDASEITAIRTAAVSGVATDLLARPDATDLAIIGSGVQARTHLEAVRVVRDVRRVRVFSPTAANREAFAERQSARQGVEIEAVASARAAVEGAHIVCTTTSSREPVLAGQWLAAGAHVNAVGSSQPHARELDAAAVARARLFVDRRESTLNESGDFLDARREGAIDDTHIRGEIGEILLGNVPGRESAEEITLFKSLGLAVEDLVAAEYVRRQADEREMGTRVALGGRAMVEPLGPIPLDEIRAAAGRIRHAVVRTPLVRLEVDDAPAEIWLKLENLQPIGSFKLRGAGNAMAQVERALLEDGVYTASAGNMAQGVAWNARRIGVPCTVVVPDHAPAAKLEAIARLGARTIQRTFQDWWRVMVDHRDPDVPGHFIHPVSDRRVIAGNGTVGLEILEDLPDVDTIVVPFGGGGLSCGIASAARGLGSAARVFAAEVATAAPLAASLEAGRPVSVEYTRSFVDGIGAGSLLEEMWPLASSVLAGSLVTSPELAARAIRTLVVRNRVVAEGAGAAAVAAALDGQAGGGKVVCVVSGGNIDPDRLAQILEGRVPD